MTAPPSKTVKWPATNMTLTYRCDDCGWELERHVWQEFRVVCPPAELHICPAREPHAVSQ